MFNLLGGIPFFSIVQTCSGNPYCWLNTHENHTPIPSIICPYMSMHVRVRTNMRCHHFWICQLRLDDGIHHRSVPVFPKQLRLGEPFPATERSLPRRWLHFYVKLALCPGSLARCPLFQQQLELVGVAICWCACSPDLYRCLFAWVWVCMCGRCLVIQLTPYFFKHVLKPMIREWIPGGHVENNWFVPPILS